MQRTVILKIPIKKDYGGYVYASNFISKICEDQPITEKEVENIVSLDLFFAKDVRNSEICKQAMKKRNEFKEIHKPENLRQVLNTFKIIFLLEVEQGEELEVVDFRYDILIKKYFSELRILTVLLGNQPFYHWYRITCIILAAAKLKFIIPYFGIGEIIRCNGSRYIMLEICINLCH